MSAGPSKKRTAGHYPAAANQNTDMQIVTLAARRVKPVTDRAIRRQRQRFAASRERTITEVRAHARILATRRRLDVAAVLAEATEREQVSGDARTWGDHR